MTTRTKAGGRREESVKFSRDGKAGWSTVVAHCSCAVMAGVSRNRFGIFARGFSSLCGGGGSPAKRADSKILPTVSYSNVGLVSFLI